MANVSSMGLDDQPPIKLISNGLEDMIRTFFLKNVKEEKKDITYPIYKLTFGNAFD